MTEQKPPPAEWLEALKVSEAEAAAGKIISGDAVRQRLRDSIARMEARQKPVPASSAQS